MRQELKSLKLSTSGKKQALMKRLQEHQKAKESACEKSLKTCKVILVNEDLTEAKESACEKSMETEPRKTTIQRYVEPYDGKRRRLAWYYCRVENELNGLSWWQSIKKYCKIDPNKRINEF